MSDNESQPVQSHPDTSVISPHCRLLNASALLSLIDKSRSDPSFSFARAAQSSQSPVSADRESSTPTPPSPPPASPHPTTEDQLESTGKALRDASDHKLKLRFAEALALICATKTGGNGNSDKENNNTAAVCLEKALGEQESYSVRVARNNDTEVELGPGLEEILMALQKLATAAHPARLCQQTETFVFRKIVQLNCDKIEQGISESTSIISEFIAIAEEYQLIRFPPNPEAEDAPSEDTESSKLSQQLTITLLPLRDLLTRLLNHTGHPRSLEGLVNNIYNLRRTTLFRNLQGLSRIPDLRKAGGLANNLSKLGRHRGAARVLVQVCQKCPSVFSNGVNIQILQQQSRMKLETFGDNEQITSLESALKIALPNIDTEELISRLSCLMNLDVPQLEGLFRTKREVEYLPHAEVQLISFYDQHPENIPYGCYIATSKKSCWLCSLFMECHESTSSSGRKYVVVGGNQQICLGWMVPRVETTSKEVTDSYERITLKMCERLEEELSDFVRRRILKPPKPAKVIVDCLSKVPVEPLISDVKHSGADVLEGKKQDIGRKKEEEEWDVVASNEECSQAEENGGSKAHEEEAKEESRVTWAMSQSIGALSAVLEVAKSTALEMATTALQVVTPKQEKSEREVMAPDVEGAKPLAETSANGVQERDDSQTKDNEEKRECTTVDKKAGQASDGVMQPVRDDKNAIERKPYSSSEETRAENLLPEPEPEIQSSLEDKQDLFPLPLGQTVISEAQTIIQGDSNAPLPDAPQGGNLTKAKDAEIGSGHLRFLNDISKGEEVRPEEIPLPEDAISDYEEPAADDIWKYQAEEEVAQPPLVHELSPAKPLPLDVQLHEGEPIYTQNGSDTLLHVENVRESDLEPQVQLALENYEVPVSYETEIDESLAQQRKIPEDSLNTESGIDEGNLAEIQPEPARQESELGDESQLGRAPPPELQPQPELESLRGRETEQVTEPLLRFEQAQAELLQEIGQQPQTEESESRPQLPTASELILDELDISTSNSAANSNPHPNSHPSPPPTASTMTEPDLIELSQDRPVTSPSPIHSRRPTTSASTRSQVQPSPQPSISSITTISNTVTHTMTGLRPAASLLACTSSRRRRSTLPSVGESSAEASSESTGNGASMMVPPSLPLPPVMDPISVGDHRHKVSVARKVMLALLVGQAGRESSTDGKLRRSSSVMLGTALMASNPGVGSGGRGSAMGLESDSLSKVALLGNLQGKSVRSMKSVGSGDRERDRDRDT